MQPLGNTTQEASHEFLLPSVAAGFSPVSAVSVLAGLLGACATGSDDSAGAASTTLTLQSSLSDPDPKAALTKVVEGYTKTKVTLNTIAIETFRAQLPTYLNSGNPPDVLTWYAGSVARDYASKGFLLDVSDLWTGSGPAPASRPRSRSCPPRDGKQIFIPTNYYWWGVFYRKSAFQEWGVQARPRGTSSSPCARRSRARASRR